MTFLLDWLYEKVSLLGELFQVLAIELQADQ